MKLIKAILSCAVLLSSISFGAPINAVTDQQFVKWLAAPVHGGVSFGTVSLSNYEGDKTDSGTARWSRKKNGILSSALLGFFTLAAALFLTFLVLQCFQRLKQHRDSTSSMRQLAANESFCLELGGGGGDGDKEGDDDIFIVDSSSKKKGKRSNGRGRGRKSNKKKDDDDDSWMRKFMRWFIMALLLSAGFAGGFAGGFFTQTPAPAPQACDQAAPNDTNTSNTGALQSNTTGALQSNTFALTCDNFDNKCAKKIVAEEAKFNETPFVHIVAKEKKVINEVIDNTPIIVYNERIREILEGILEDIRRDTAKTITYESIGERTEERETEEPLRRLEFLGRGGNKLEELQNLRVRAGSKFRDIITRTNDARNYVTNISEVMNDIKKVEKKSNIKLTNKTNQLLHGLATKLKEAHKYATYLKDINVEANRKNLG